MSLHSPSASTLAYPALDAGEDTIRLIHLHPSDEWESPLVCQLRNNISLKYRPEYTALSYCWGEPVFDHPVLIDGQKIMVTATLAQALRCIRRQKWQIVWADQLCIDQNNVKEKNRQVPMMWRIFSQAMCVWIYLGQGLHNPPSIGWHIPLSLHYRLPTLLSALRLTQSVDSFVDI